MLDGVTDHYSNYVKRYDLDYDRTKKISNALKEMRFLFGLYNLVKVLT